jgi:hypothetical protein
MARPWATFAGSPRAACPVKAPTPSSRHVSVATSHVRSMIEILVLSCGLAALLGFAAQRASICNVRAIAEVIGSGTAHMLVSFGKTVLVGPRCHDPVLLARTVGGQIQRSVCESDQHRSGRQTVWDVSMKKPEPRQPGLLPMRSPRRKMPDRSRRNAKNQHPGKDEFPHGFLLRLQHRPQGPDAGQDRTACLQTEMPVGSELDSEQVLVKPGVERLPTAVRADLANRSNKRSTGQNTRIRS